MVLVSMICLPRDFYPRSPCGERRWTKTIAAEVGDFYPRSPCGERPCQWRRSVKLFRQFLSTLSLRRATDELTDDVSTGGISIHALLAESDCMGVTVLGIQHNFYPRSPCGERPADIACGDRHKLCHFYPRSPCGERQCRLLDTRIYFTISIHALLAESDTSQVPTWFGIPNFYPRSPCGERQHIVGTSQVFNNFYPRSPCGERHAADISTRREANISIHALLAESDSQCRTFASGIYDFYPRSPCGERLISLL